MNYAEPTDRRVSTKEILAAVNRLKPGDRLWSSSNAGDGCWGRHPTTGFLYQLPTAFNPLPVSDLLPFQTLMQQTLYDTARRDGSQRTSTRKRKSTSSSLSTTLSRRTSLSSLRNRVTNKHKHPSSATTSNNSDEDGKWRRQLLRDALTTVLQQCISTALSGGPQTIVTDYLLGTKQSEQDEADSSPIVFEQVVHLNAKKTSQQWIKHFHLQGSLSDPDAWRTSTAPDFDKDPISCDAFFKLWDGPNTMAGHDPHVWHQSTSKGTIVVVYSKQ